MGNNNIILQNNMIKLMLLKDRTTSQYNSALVAIVTLLIFYYTQNECSNIVQRGKTQFVFTNNIPKQFIELFYSIEIFVSYESFHHDLQANLKAIIKEILKKTQTRQFFILYDDINFYQNVCNQKIFNCSTLVSYIARYICFMKSLNGIENKNNS